MARSSTAPSAPPRTRARSPNGSLTTILAHSSADPRCTGCAERYHATVSAPVDPPIPVPDVPGADASTRGLPRRIDLTLRQRLIVDSSAVADIGLRTALASVVGAAMLPQVALAALTGSHAREQHDALRYYAELGAA